MFCNYCAAPNPDVAAFCNKCGKPLARPVAAPPVAQPVAQPITYVMEVTSAAAASPLYSAPIATAPTGAPRAVSVSPVSQVAAAPVIGALSLAARAEFTDGLIAEVSHQIEDKCFPGAIAAWIITLIAVARFNMVLAFVLAFVVAGIVFKIVKSILEDKYLRPIVDLSDEMLVNRYNEAKADSRAARTRTAISWAVIAIIAVLLAVAWLAAHRQ